MTDICSTVSCIAGSSAATCSALKIFCTLNGAISALSQNANEMASGVERLTDGSPSLSGSTPNSF